MNAEKFQRVTVVLDRGTAQSLKYVSHAMGLSVSELTRGLLEEPVSMMRSSVHALTTGAPSDRAEALESLELFAADALADLDLVRDRL